MKSVWLVLFFMSAILLGVWIIIISQDSRMDELEKRVAVTSDNKPKDSHLFNTKVYSSADTLWHVESSDTAIVYSHGKATKHVSIFYGE